MYYKNLYYVYTGNEKTVMVRISDRDDWNDMHEYYFDLRRYFCDKFGIYDEDAILEYIMTHIQRRELEWLL